MSEEFQGFTKPTENYSKLPHDFINSLHIFSSLAELKVVLYILRHTWGFQEDYKHISTNEFVNGRKKKDRTRLDNGCGMSKNSIADGLNRAVEHGFILKLIDNSDLGRVTHYYKLRSNKDEVTVVYAVDPTIERHVVPWHTVDPTIKKKVYGRSKGRCSYCDDIVRHWHYDHIIPKSHGGTDSEENLCLACPTCNLSKNAKTPEEWGRLPHMYTGNRRVIYTGYIVQDFDEGVRSWGGGRVRS